MSSQARDESDRKDEKFADELIKRLESYLEAFITYSAESIDSRRSLSHLRKKLKETLLMLIRGQHR